MHVLVLNIGSSSLKFAAFDADTDQVISTGRVDKIGKDARAYLDGVERAVACSTHDSAFQVMQKHLASRSVQHVGVVVHRVVHGGELYHGATRIDRKVLQRIEQLFALSPLHNPLNHAGILLAKAAFPDAVQVAVFDTAFYHTLPAKAFLYGIPYKYYRKYSIRKYGFHGISHRYIAGEVQQQLGKKKLRHISCHLGNGSSITAIHNGVPVDTTMGFTPLQGVMMGTRSGSFDPAIATFLQQKEGFSAAELDEVLNHKSGILGVSEISSDVRDIYHFFLQGDERARLTLEMVAYQVRRFIGSMIAVLGGVDVISFTGGVGENAFYLRRMALEHLENLGIRLDTRKNQMNEGQVQHVRSKVAVLVLPTNEELQMYREAKELLGSEGRTTLPIPIDSKRLCFRRT